MKYILKKAYPGHTLGETHSSDKSTKWYGTYFYDAHPEFWKKVEKVDYEVLRITPSKNNLFIKSGFMSISHSETDSHYWDIYSVERLSDGEIFTVGDEITVDGESGKYKIDKILKTTDSVEVMVKTKGIDISCGLGSIFKLPAKTSLFTTEDGVDIFDEKQKVFSVSECDYLLQNHQDFAWVKSRNPSRKYHHFSTKEKAEEYVMMNKPCLSIKDVAPIFGQMHLDNSGTVLARMTVKLQGLVKSKL